MLTIYTSGPYPDQNPGGGGGGERREEGGGQYFFYKHICDYFLQQKNNLI